MSKSKLPDNEETKQEIIQEEVEVDEEQEQTGISKKQASLKEGWNPKTELGKKVKMGQITKIEDILGKGIKILEPEVIDCLIFDLESDLLSIGQSKGKFGGGKRSIWRQTQKKTKEGNKPKFTAMAVIGNKKGYVGLGLGKSKETVPAREKAIRKAKLNLISIKRSCGSWECGCNQEHSIPFKVTGKNGSVIVTLMPAPKGTGLVVEKECKKILELVGIKDIYSKTSGHTKTKQNLLVACFKALNQINKTKIK